ncbi:MAG: hypothetical protein AAF587_14235 [Bacteroidota bacterium]
MKPIFAAIPILMLVCLSELTGQTREDLNRQWLLKHYEYFGFAIDPEEEETEDFLFLKADGSYSSKDKGQLNKGFWELEQDRLILYDEAREESISLLIKHLSRNRLKLEIGEGLESIIAVFVLAKE